jgi:hypothetical protein
MKLTKEQLKQIIKEELESVMTEGDLSRQRAFADLRWLPYGKLIQRRIQELYNEKNTVELGEMQNYTSRMTVTQAGFKEKPWTGYNPLVGVPKVINISAINNERSREADNYRRAVRKAIQVAIDLLNQSSPATAPEEKPGVMDRIKGFFKEE